MIFHRRWMQDACIEGRQYQAVGMQNKGAYLKITDGVKAIVKSVKKIEVVFHQKGVIYT